MQKGFAPIIILVGILVLASVGGTYYFFKVKTPEQRACTMDAKICPDGSSVGRSGPNCEFAPCPSSKPTSASDVSREPTGAGETANWKTYTNTIYGFEFKYPTELSLEQAYEPEKQSSVVVSGNLNKSKPNSRFAVIIGYTWGVSMDAKRMDAFKSCTSDDECYRLYLEDINKFPRNNLTEVSAIILGKKIPGFQFMDDNQFVRYFPLSKNGKFFLISFSFVNYSQAEVGNIQTLLNKILSTFKFLGK